MILAFTLLVTALSSYFNIMATFCLPKNYIFDNPNYTRAHIAQLVEHFHGKEEAVCSIHTVGTEMKGFRGWTLNGWHMLLCKKLRFIFLFLFL